MGIVTKSSIRWYRFRTGLGIFFLTVLGAPLRGLGAMFGGNMLFAWAQARDYKAWLMAKQIGHQEKNALYEIGEELQAKVQSFEWQTLLYLDEGKACCPICGAEFFHERLVFSTPQPCMNLQDIHPHYITDVPEDPNPWAWAWYQRHGYKPPSEKCDRVYTPPESLLEHPAAAMALLGKPYWMEHPNYFWDNGYAAAPQWYIDHWAQKSLAA